jgi:hypothetical protein
MAGWFGQFVMCDPSCKGLGAGGVGFEGLPVGPFNGEDAVEAFDLAVLPGAVGSDGDVVEAEAAMASWKSADRGSSWR